MEKTTIYLPADLRWYLKDAARRTGKSQADLIRDALEVQRNAAPPQLPASIGAFRSGTKTGITREQIKSDFHAHLDRKYPRRADA